MSPKLRGPLPPLEPGDTYLDEWGRMVFTEQYHRKRGYCCESGCRHCPFGFKAKGKAPTGPDAKDQDSD